MYVGRSRGAAAAPLINKSQNAEKMAPSDSCQPRQTLKRSGLE